MLRRRLAAGLAASALAVGSAWLSSGAHGAATTAARTPSTGVVVIETRLVGGTSAAGTGIVLTSSGEVLTNNHVIRGETSVRAITTNGKSYSARVLGYSVSKDIAVLQLSGAHGLQTALIGDSTRARQGSAVTAVGNAGGTGSLTTVTGKITDTGRVITVSDLEGNTTQLTGMIETNAPLQPGDSGGPLLLGGRVVGVDAAGERGYQFNSAGSGIGFAIPINTAFSIVRQVESGRSTLGVHIGPTAFLGVELEPGSRLGGVVVHGVVPGGPADRAGVQAGDVITRIGFRAVISRLTIRNVLLQTKPGQALKLSWKDQSGHTHTATVKPVSGPPQ